MWWLFLPLILSAWQIFLCLVSSLLIFLHPLSRLFDVKTLSLSYHITPCFFISFLSHYFDMNSLFSLVTLMWILFSLLLLQYDFSFHLSSLWCDYSFSISSLRCHFYFSISSVCLPPHATHVSSSSLHSTHALHAIMYHPSLFREAVAQPHKASAASWPPYLAPFPFSRASHWSRWCSQASMITDLEFIAMSLSSAQQWAPCARPGASKLVGAAPIPTKPWSCLAPVAITVHCVEIASSRSSALQARTSLDTSPQASSLLDAATTSSMLHSSEPTHHCNHEQG